jgi:hypothetical protein
VITPSEGQILDRPFFRSEVWTDQRGPARPLKLMTSSSFPHTQTPPDPHHSDQVTFTQDLHPMSSSLLLTPMDALPLPSDESKVLVIYTGGTIGMLVGAQGYVPEPNFLTDTLRCQSRFHDPLQDSLFSNAASVKGYREWSTSSGRSTPRSTASSDSVSPHSTLTIRSSRPIGRTELAPADDEYQHGSPGHHQPVWQKVSDGVYEARVPSLVTPRSSIPGGGTKRIRYAILEVSIISERRSRFSRLFCNAVEPSLR